MEPTCGSGILCLQSAQTFANRGYDPCEQLVFQASDLDSQCVHMQLSLYCVPAVVIRGDVITHEEYDRWYISLYIWQNWVWREPMPFKPGRNGSDEILKMICEPWYAKARMLGNIIKKLNKAEELETGSRHIRWDQMAAKAEVLDLLTEGGANFTALKSIRVQYNKKFVDELCWSFPFSIDDHLGCALLSVQEGILCLPYNGPDNDTYEQFDLDAVKDVDSRPGSGSGRCAALPSGGTLQYPGRYPSSTAPRWAVRSWD